MEREKFYQSKTWKLVRKNIWLKQACLCAECKRPVYVDGISDYIPKKKRLKGIVHHKEFLTESNINDVFVSLNEDNLVGLCINCHNKKHFKTGCLKDDVRFNEKGDLISK